MNSYTVNPVVAPGHVAPQPHGINVGGNRALATGAKPKTAHTATSVTTTIAQPTRWLIVSWIAAVHILALWALPSFSWANLGLAAILWFVSGCLGITVGFHRLLAHRSFKTSKPLSWFFAFCGTLAFQGGVLEWVARHRMHHAFTDTEDDPHNARRGFWYSHMFWLFRHDDQFDSVERHKTFARDIARDPVMLFLSHTLVMSLIQIALLLGLAFWLGWDAALWGVFVRLMVGYHCTWFVNSATHKYGYRTYETNEDSRNCWWVALVTFGEGWHNNHHADQRACRAGRKFWEFDITYLIILALQKCRLVWDIEEPKSLAKKK